MNDAEPESAILVPVPWAEAAIGDVRRSTEDENRVWRLLDAFPFGPAT